MYLQFLYSLLAYTTLRCPSSDICSTSFIAYWHRYTKCANIEKSKYKKRKYKNKCKCKAKYFHFYDYFILFMSVKICPSVCSECANMFIVFTFVVLFYLRDTQICFVLFYSSDNYTDFCRFRIHLFPQMVLGFLWASSKPQQPHSQHLETFMCIRQTQMYECTYVQ